LGGCSHASNRDVTAVRAVAATEAARTFRIDGESKSWNTSDPKRSTSSSHTTGEVDRAQQSTHMVSKTRSSDPSDGAAGEHTFEIIQIGRDVWVRFSAPTVNEL